MGAWGSGPFDNDTAADWVYGLVDATTDEEALKVLESALSAAAETPEGEYLDADEGLCAVAAAAVVAAATGSATDDLPENVAEWLTGHAAAVPVSLRGPGRKALNRVAGPNSELAELWAEGADDDGFASSLLVLAERLTGD
jgi:hypothetical protein